MRTKRILLVDGSSYIYRAFYAISALSNSSGLPTNAIFGFTTMLLKLLKAETPEYLAVCFDLPEPTFRHQAFVDYKAQRKPTPDELVIQIPWIKKIIHAFGIKTIELAGFEADDIMGTLAKRGEQQGFEVVLVTGDKDMLQLVNPNISVLRMHRGEEYIYDETKVIEKYGIPPNKFPDLVGLMGDSSDNIPGVPGIGEKIASRLIREYRDLDSVLNHIEAIKGDKIREQLHHFTDQARLSKSLATIQTSIPLAISIDELKLKLPQPDELIALFRELEFNKLVDEIPKVPPQAVSVIEYEEISAAPQIPLLQKTLNETRKISLVLATDSEKQKMTGLALSLSNSRNYYIPWNREMKSFIKDILESQPVDKIGFDIKSQMNTARRNGIAFRKGTFDVMLAGYLLAPHLGQRTVSQLAMTYLGRQMQSPVPPASAGLRGATENETATMELELTATPPIRYWVEQSNTILALAEVLAQELKENQLDSLFAEIEMPLVEIIAEMEIAGIKIDIAYFTELSNQFDRELTKGAQGIYELAGGEFNINSPKQLSAILFEKLKLPVKKKTKTGYSTNVEVLEELAMQHPLPAKILEFRTLSKLKSTYVDALLDQVEPETQLLHTSYHQAGTATGRLSSSEPNLQNLPAQGDWAEKIRAGFIPREANNVFLSADYSQIELRILAHLSQDETLTHIFAYGEDIHTQTAVEIFKVIPGMVTKEMRRAAKVVNFGIIYGLSPFGLAQSLKISREEAKAYIARYFARYSQVQEYIAKTISAARENGYVTTLFNRRRSLPDINSPSRDLREFSERAAINTPIQGTAADLLKIAMRNCYRKMKDEQLRSLQLLTIHDELVFEVPQSELEIMKIVVKQEMEAVAKLSVPIIVNIKVGKNLAEC
ncbi:MAG: DNA polymerase I [bacterium]|nr:DNA polymerase I [bacterium]